MELITLNAENLEQEHICCAISNNKDPQVKSKKDWLSRRLDEGLVFLKGNVRGKCFLEYIPAEYAWAPILAPGYMHINCFWISGQFKGHGYANELLDACIRDSKAKGKAGLCVISSPKKKPFLSDPGYLVHRGFRTADDAQPFFTLLYLPFSDDAPVPAFRPQVKQPGISGRGFTIYYSHACPFPAKYVPLLETVAREEGIPLESVLLDSREKAQNAPAAWTNFALFHNGRYLTNEIPSEKKFLALAAKLGELPLSPEKDVTR